MSIFRTEQMTREIQQSSRIGQKDYSKYKGVAPATAGSKIVIPSKDSLKIWENCYKVACQYIGYREKANLYRIATIHRRAIQLSHNLLSQLFMKFYQDEQSSSSHACGNHEMMMRVSFNLETAFQILRNSKRNFKISDMINAAFGLTVGDTNAIGEEDEISE